MTSQAVDFSMTVYMNQRDITPWCRRIKVSQPEGYVEKEFEITTNAWHMFQENARYDIYASYDPANPRQECMIRQGWILPDKRRSVRVSRGEMPTITIRGKGWSSISFRRAPRETIVCIPVYGTAGYNMNYARRVLLNYDGPVGRIRIFPGCARVDQAVHRLGMNAWIGISWNLPFYPLQPVVIPAGKTYWDAILDLIEPYAPEIYFSHWSNHIVIADSLSRWYGRWPMNVDGGIIRHIDAVPTNHIRVRRVLVRIPAWR
jgi:hypothetical protein